MKTQKALLGAFTATVLLLSAVFASGCGDDTGTTTDNSVIRDLSGTVADMAVTGDLTATGDMAGPPDMGCYNPAAATTYYQILNACTSAMNLNKPNTIPNYKYGDPLPGL